MSSRTTPETRIVWAFFVAAALIAVAGLVPILLAGPSGRVSLVIVPFWIGAIAVGACALIQERGKWIAAGLYFVAGLAVVYGIIAMLAVALRLAVVGTCPAVGRCPAGFLPPLTGAENTGFGFAIGMGIVGILVGFFGLVVLWRHTAATARAQAATVTPPVRRIPPVKPKPTEPAAPPVEAADEPAAAAAPEPAKELDELPAHEEELELPAHVDGEFPESGDPASPPQPD